jgi:glycerol uptake facilitator-like aquaporin
VTVDLGRKVAAELLGTAFLVMAVIGSGIAAERLSPDDSGLQLLERAMGLLRTRDASALIAGQVVGGFLGAVLANLMFGLDAVSIASHERTGGGLWLGEVIATLGLVLIIFGSLRSGRSDTVAFAVGGYITAAYWFTSSTSFANPAVTFARMFSDTFAGIAPSSAPMFVLMQLVGGALALGLVHLLYPTSTTAMSYPDDAVRG